MVLDRPAQRTSCLPPEPPRSGTRHFGCNVVARGWSNPRERENPELLLGPHPVGCYSRNVLAGDVTMGTDVLEFVYYVCFFLGLGFAVLSALLSGVFSGHVGPHIDMGGAHVDMGGIHTDGSTHIGPTEGAVHSPPLSPVSI